MVEPASTESDEQVDLDGDNDIEEEMMEDDAEEQVEDDGGQDVDDDEYPKEGEESGGGTSLEPASTADGVDGASSSLWEQDNVNDEDDSQKRAELLALPPHGSEIFIGGLHRDATEEDLRVLCESIGEVSEVSLFICFCSLDISFFFFYWYL
ncbi:hypothetical protein QJS04_geneDACA010850 [Acorus gramineus]|uniref:RRM domain-containing protein n=1 Tax=Acorus gramineus TaxID=55184 RepID=A0AAV9BA82_ACOGR|nr:hypothetical protein QJS04_geneDACA010850 [Acorus gramineus]